jgi:hypothetical protein
MGIEDMNPVTPHPPSSSHLFTGVLMWGSCPLEANMFFIILSVLKFVILDIP